MKMSLVRHNSTRCYDERSQVSSHHQKTRQLWGTERDALEHRRDMMWQTVANVSCGDGKCWYMMHIKWYNYCATTCCIP